MRIIEAGHYYEAKGPTKFSVIGWNIMQKMVFNGDKNMLFIDDFHDWDCVPEQEKKLPTVKFTPEADFFVLESELQEEAQEVLERLKSLSKRKKAKQDKTGKWHCSGFPLTDESGTPNCVLLDAGLTLHKRELGFKRGINILPKHYQDEQERLFRIINKVIPDFYLKVILYNQDGSIFKKY